ncbi:MAG: SGNH/GDSL hydrolase family protein [Lentisphaeria bacterium]
MAWGMKNLLICLFGSSIMEGRIGVQDPNDRWYNLFQRLLSQAHPDTCFPIINSAVGGESTREVMNRFDRDILPYSPDFCLFMVGGNNHDCMNPHRILAEGEIQCLLENFVSRLPVKTKPVGVVINPVVDEWHFVTKHPAFKEHLESFNGSLDASLNPDRDIARAFFIQHGWPYLDLYALMVANPKNYVLPEDGIHMNKAGHTLFAEEMFKLVNRLL